MKLGISLKKFYAASPQVVLIQGFPTHHFPKQFFFFFFFLTLKNVLGQTSTMRLIRENNTRTLQLTALGGPLEDGFHFFVCFSFFCKYISRQNKLHNPMGRSPLQALIVPMAAYGLSEPPIVDYVN
jgi:hypothetical protein